MKKKNLQSLRLHKHKIANLSLLHTKKGGTEGTNGMQTTDTSINNCTTIATFHYNCDTNTCIDVYTAFTYTSCPDTNGSDTKVPPPTEYASCNDSHNNNPGFSG